MKVLFAIFLSMLGVFGWHGAAHGAESVDRAKVVLQVSDNDVAKWNLTLNNVKNIQSAYGVGNVDIEIVAYGPGIQMLRFESMVGNRIQEVSAAHVKVAACENTMQALDLKKEDMLPGISYVPAGVVEVIKLQQKGYAYIKP